MLINLDTHVLIFALQGQLTRRENEILGRNRWGISAIVLWEITKLHQHGRINLSLDDPLIDRALSQTEIWPITRDICLNLSKLDFRADPADELIAATSLTHGVLLITRDRRIRSSKVVRFA